MKRLLLKSFLLLYRTSALFVAMLSILLAGATVYVCWQYVPTKFLSVPMATLGGFVSGSFFAVCFAKWLHVHDALVQESKAETNADKERNRKLQEENTRLSKRVRQLENQKIDVNSLNKIMKIAFVETDMTIKDCQITTDDIAKTEWYQNMAGLMSAERKKYIGIIEKKFKANFGCDIQKLKCRIVGDSIEIAGMKTESLGCKDISTEYLMELTLTEKMRKTSAGWDVKRDEGNEIADDAISRAVFGRPVDMHDAQRNVLEARIGKGAGEEFQLIDERVREMTKSFLELLFKPTGKRVRFVDDPNEIIDESCVDWKPLLVFQEGYNKDVEKLLE